MIGFQDRTFCSGDGCAKFNSCPRALTDEVRAAAERWWGGPGAPISEFAEPRGLSCWTNHEPEKPND